MCVCGLEVNPESVYAKIYLVVYNLNICNKETFVNISLVKFCVNKF